MKTKLYPVLLLLLAALALVTCSKSSEVTPDPAALVAGTYTMTRLQFDSAGVSEGYDLPFTQGSYKLSGTITAQRDSATVVNTTYTIKETGYSDYNGKFGQLKLKGSASPYDIYVGTNKIGTADGTNFTIDFSYTDKGITYRQVYKGRKQ